MHNSLSEHIAAIIGGSEEPTADQYDALRLWMAQFPTCDLGEVDHNRQTCDRMATTNGTVDGYDLMFCDTHAEALLGDS
jgi:hypothetical protein